MQWYDIALRTFRKHYWVKFHVLLKQLENYLGV